jgi:dTDP-4-dehydrorhamnose 3,5-epimerase
MNIIKTALPGVLILEPKVISDNRGVFMEIFHAKRYAEAGISYAFVQDNYSKSVQDTLRGLHYQEPSAQGKLVQVLAGTIYDVVVDIRRGSPTFRMWRGVELSSENRKQLWVPPGYAHGFLVRSESAEVIYKCTDFYRPDVEHSIVWDDPEIAIRWPVQHPLLSKKDAQAPRLSAVALLPQYEGSTR